MSKVLSNILSVNNKKRASYQNSLNVQKYQVRKASKNNTNFKPKHTDINLFEEKVQFDTRNIRQKELKSSYLPNKPLVGKLNLFQAKKLTQLHDSKYQEEYYTARTIRPEILYDDYSTRTGNYTNRQCDQPKINNSNNNVMISIKNLIGKNRQKTNTVIQLNNKKTAFNNNMEKYVVKTDRNHCDKNDTFGKNIGLNDVNYYMDKNYKSVSDCLNSSNKSNFINKSNENISQRLVNAIGKKPRQIDYNSQIDSITKFFGEKKRTANKNNISNNNASKDIFDNAKTESFNKMFNKTVASKPGQTHKSSLRAKYLDLAQNSTKKKIIDIYDEESTNKYSNSKDIIPQKKKNIIIINNSSLNKESKNTSGNYFGYNIFYSNNLTFRSNSPSEIKAANAANNKENNSNFKMKKPMIYLRKAGNRGESKSNECGCGNCGNKESNRHINNCRNDNGKSLACINGNNTINNTNNNNCSKNIRKNVVYSKNNNNKTSKNDMKIEVNKFESKISPPKKNVNYNNYLKEKVLNVPASKYDNRILFKKKMFNKTKQHALDKINITLETTNPSLLKDNFLKGKIVNNKIKINKLNFNFLIKNERPEKESHVYKRQFLTQRNENNANNMLPGINFNNTKREKSTNLLGNLLLKHEPYKKNNNVFCRNTHLLGCNLTTGNQEFNLRDFIVKHQNTKDLPLNQNKLPKHTVDSFDVEESAVKIRSDSEKEEESGVLSLDDVKDIIKYDDMSGEKTGDNYMFFPNDFEIFYKENCAFYLRKFFGGGNKMCGFESKFMMESKTNSTFPSSNKEHKNSGNVVKKIRKK